VFDNNVGTGTTVTKARADPLNVLCKNGTLELRRNFFTISVVKDWNTVPSDIKNISIPGKFKTALKKWQDGSRAEQRCNNTRPRKRVPDPRQQPQKFFKRTNWPMEDNNTGTVQCTL
jgi:hypothetical protein